MDIVPLSLPITACVTAEGDGGSVMVPRHDGN
jgi:hypothetical protein